MLINLILCPMKAHRVTYYNNYVFVLLSHNVQHSNKLLYWVTVDTSSKYKKEQWTVTSCAITMYPSPLAKSSVT